MIKKKLPPRLQYEIRYAIVPLKLSTGALVHGAPCWALFAPDGVPIARAPTKSSLVKSAEQQLTFMWLRARVRSELTIKTKSGKRIQDRRTYGDDPRRTKG